MQCRMFRSITSLYPLDSSSTPLLMRIKTVSRHCQLSPEGQNHAQIENDYRFSDLRLLTWIPIQKNLLKIWHLIDFGNSDTDWVFDIKYSFLGLLTVLSFLKSTLISQYTLQYLQMIYDAEQHLFQNNMEWGK